MTVTDTTRDLTAETLTQLAEDAATLAAKTSRHREKHDYAVGVSAGPGCWWRVAIAHPGSEHLVAATLLDEGWSGMKTVRVWVLAPNGDLVMAMTGSPAQLRRELVGRDVHPLLRPAVTAWRMHATARQRRDPVGTHPALAYGHEIARYMMAVLGAANHLVAFGRTDEDVEHAVTDDARDAREWALAELTVYADDEEVRVFEIVGGVIVHQAAGSVAEVRRTVAGWNTPAMLVPFVRAWRIRRATAVPGITRRTGPAASHPAEELTPHDI